MKKLKNGTPAKKHFLIRFLSLFKGDVYIVKDIQKHSPQVITIGGISVNLHAIDKKKYQVPVALIAIPLKK